MALPSTTHCTLECHMNNYKVKNLSPHSFIVILSILHALLTFGSLFFASVVHIKSDSIFLEFSTDKRIFIYIVPMVSMVSYFGSNLFYNTQLANISKNKSLNEKLMLYLQACALRYAFVVAAVIMGTMAFGAYNHIFYLVISLLLLLYLFKLRPTKYRVMADLELNLEDQQYFQKVKEEIK